MSTTLEPPPRRPKTRPGASGGGWAPNLTPKVAVRIALLGGIAMALLGVLLVRLWFLQVVSGEEYAERAEGNRLRTVVIEAPRGNLLDRNGEVIVTNRLGKNIVARPRELTGARREQVIGRLATRLGVPPENLMRRMENGDERPFESVILARNVDRTVQFYLSERRRQFPGIALEDSWVRTYPEGPLAAHVLGSTGRIPAEEYDEYRRRGYLGNEVVGRGGVEFRYETVLRGSPGERVVEVDAAGEPVGRELVSSRAPTPGHDVELTIDLPTQRALEESLRVQADQNAATGAAGVALDPRTGEVLAMASYPTYDPEAFVRGRAREIERLSEDPRRPLLNRAIGGQYPPASTFKAITATAALANGVISPGELVDSPSAVTLYEQEFSNFRGRAHGLVDLPRALEVSSDTYFYKLGDAFYRAQDSPLQATAEGYGFGAPTGIDLPGEIAPDVPTPEWKRRQFAGPEFSNFQRSWTPGDTIQLTIGQGFMLVTPLQLAAAYAAIADGTTRHTPTVGRRVLDPNGRVLQQLAAGRPTHPMEAGPAVLTPIREGLLRASNGAEGTATAVFAGLPEEVRVAGKTGTAEPGDGGEDHSWFVGYAPYDDPRIAVAVVIERGGTGSNAAAPAVCRTMSAYLSFDGELCGEGAAPN